MRTGSNANSAWGWTRFWRKRPLAGTAIEAVAPAKINLALHLRGRRPDGYHLIESLVSFAEFGDRISVSAAPSLTLSVSGPYAGKTPSGGENLVMKAARLMAAGQGAAVFLRKNIPVSAGLGGGSSDAAAAIKLLSRLWNLPQPDAGLSARLGADLPVCLNGKPSRVEGIGERVTELPPLPPLSAVLVNPGHMLPTGEVYAAAAGIAAAGLPPLPRFDSAGGLAGWLRLQRNDLENTAVLLCPAVADVLTALRRCRNCLMARVSGSGATCFGLFDDPQSAGSAAALLRRGNPGWWVRETAV